MAEVLSGSADGKRRPSRARGVAKVMGSIAVAAARTSAKVTVKGASVIASKAKGKRKGVQAISEGDGTPSATQRTPEASPRARTKHQPGKKKVQRALVLDAEFRGNGSPMATQEHAVIPRSYGTI
eukprot:m.347450 g.347450  ORF g.347450 m.347450 type:complete len:125 (-) comp27924_c0_seq1:3963-4337(-)